jgi:S1-C subfamily serine protease
LIWQNPETFELSPPKATGPAEHLLHVVDASPQLARGANVGAAPKASPSTDLKYHLVPDSVDLAKQVSAHTKLAFAFASAKEPVLRGGIGSRIFREAAPGVVLVITGDELGSGIILNQAGQVLTNWHVVKGASHIGVMLKPPTGQQLRPADMYEAHLKKYDEVADCPASAHMRQIG